MLLAAMVAVALLAAAPALAQDEPAVVADTSKGTPVAKAGGAQAKVDCPGGIKEAKAGGVVAKAPCPPPPPPKAAPAPAPAKAAPAPAPPKAAAPAPQLPKTGGAGTASLFALGAGALLVAGGLLARRILR